MQPDSLQSSEETTDRQDRQVLHERDRNELVRLPKTIVVSDHAPREMDNAVVAFDYYNCFNYSLLAGEQRNINLTVGITSSSPGEGKTLVASNLGVSLAMGYERETVLVDLNLEKPRLHDIFGTVQSPGLVEALQNGSVHVSKTDVKHLHVLSAGSINGHGKPGEKSKSVFSQRFHKEPVIGLKQLASFRDVIRSLEQKYEFVIVDMPAIHTKGFPILYANELNGLLVVVDTKRTKREDIDKMFRQLHERQVLGFIFNRFVDEDA